MFHCPRCHHENDDDAFQCMHCGHLLKPDSPRHATARDRIVEISKETPPPPAIETPAPPPKRASSAALTRKPSTERPTSVAATVLASFALLFGIGPFFAAFVPAFGMFSILTLIPATLLALLALGVAIFEGAKRILPVIALTICCFGAMIAVFQIFAVAAVANETAKSRPTPLPQVFQTSTYNPTNPTGAPRPQPGSIQNLQQALSEAAKRRAAQPQPGAPQ